MPAYIAGLYCSLALAAFVLAWITYCMFFKEKSRKRFYVYNISDVEARNATVQEENEKREEKPLKSSVASLGVLVLPPVHKQKDEYKSRPDYPESSTQTLNENLVEILESTPPIDGINVNNMDTLPMDTKSQIQSEV